MSDLFLDRAHPLVFEKIAAPIKLSDNPDNWQKEVASEIFKQVPFLSDYAVNVIIEKANPERGYAFGSIEVTNISDAPEASQKQLPKIIIPLIVKDRMLLPLDIAMDGKDVFPLSERRLREHLFRTDSLELSTRKPQDQGLVDQLYPPLRTNYGYGNAVATGVGTGGFGKFAAHKLLSRFGPNSAWKKHLFAKKASLLEAILPTIHAADADEFVSVFNRDPSISLAATQNEAFMKAAFAIAGAEYTPVEKTAEALVASIKPTVVQVQKLASGNFKVKWANAGAFAPQEGIVSPDQAAGMTGTDRVVRMNPGEAITVSTDVAKKTTLEDEKLEQVREFGCYRVQNAETGEPMVGWIMPVMDFEMQTLPLYLFTDGMSYSVQDEIAGSRVLGNLEDFLAVISGQAGQPKMEAPAPEQPATPPPPDAAPAGGMPKMGSIRMMLMKMAADAGMQPGGAADPSQGAPEGKVDGGPAPTAGMEPPMAEVEADPTPQGDGVFISLANERALSLPPVTIRATTTAQEGSVSYQAEDMWGEPVTLHMAPGAQAVMELGEGAFAIPDSFKWVPLGNTCHLVKSPLEMSKVAEARAMPTIITLRTTGEGEFHLDGAPVDLLRRSEHEFLKAAETEFLLVAMGMNPFEVKEKLAQVRMDGLVKIAGLNTLMPLSILHKEMVKKAAVALGNFPYELRKNLIKEAAALEDGETVDNILSMGFINPENISTFANYLPVLDETAAKLAEMLVASRLGLNLIPEGAVERAMKALDEVIEGLRMLEQKSQEQ